MKSFLVLFTSASGSDFSSQVIRDGTSAAPEFVNQLDIYRKFESSKSDGSWYQGTVGPSTVLLHQKPGWRSCMGNPLKEGNEICDYPEVFGLDDSTLPHEL